LASSKFFSATCWYFIVRSRLMSHPKLINHPGVLNT
jgi:hypothetical protein